MMRKKQIVYFVQRGASGPIKIGTTTGNLRARLMALQISSPDPLYLIGHIRGLETDIHIRFRAHHISGEWFDPHEDIFSFVRLNRLPPPNNYDAVLPVAVHALPGKLRNAIELERRRMSRVAGAEVKTSAVIRAILEEKLNRKRATTSGRRAA
jgi:hypothetical protein